MTNTVGRIGLALVLAVAAGILMGTIGLLGFDGPPPVSAQADTTAPTISSVAITSDSDENDADLGAWSVGRSGGSIVQSTSWASGVYRVADDVEVTLTFSENVTVTGSPELELAIGSNNRTAEYESAEGSAVVFSYTVAEGDSDSDGIAINANRLTLNGGSIKDAADNDANLSHTALAAQDGHKVDGVRPRLKLTTSDRLKFMPSSGGSDGAYTTDEELIVRAEFTEEGVRGSVTGRPRVTLNFDGGEMREATWDPSLIFSPAQYPLVRFFSYVVQEGDLASEGPTISANSVDVNGGFIRDAAGNDAILTHSAVAADSSFIVDAVAPTVSSIAITSGPGDDDTYGTGDKVEVTVTFSENMSLPTSITCGSDVVHCKAELELDIGGTAKNADYQSHDGAEVVYAYTVQAGDTDDNGIAIGANKLTGQHIKDATGKFGYGINDADLSHDAVAADSGHKVATSVQPQESTDATLSALTLSGINFGTFASGTTSYTAQVAYSVSETTVTPTVNDSGASHVIKLGGVTDSDGVIDLAVGSNVITIEVTAEDEETTQTYTVTVTRLTTSLQIQASTDATLSGLTLSDVDLGTFASSTTSYTAQVGNDVLQTTVTPTANDSAATYVIKLGGVTDSDGVIDLAVGSNVITIAVTAEDDSTTRTYTITVTRAEPPSTDATLSGLTLSGGIDFGTFASGTTSYTAQVGNDVLQTTVTPTANDSAATYVIKLGGVTDSDGVIDLAVGSNVITIAVTAEDGNTTRTYTITVTRAEPPSTDATLSALTLSRVDFGSFDSTTTAYTAQVVNTVTQTTVTPAVNDSGARSVIKLGGVTDSDGTVSLAVGSNVITIAVTAEDGNTTRTYTVTVTRAEPPSTDATLKSLSLSEISIGEFRSVTDVYNVDVDNSVTQTTVTPTVNDSGANYKIKLGGVQDFDGVVALAVGSNTITIEVTAEDGITTRTYTVKVTRAAPTVLDPLSTDAALSALTLSGVDFGRFDSTTTSYAAQVANTVSQTTVTPTVNDSGASYVIKLGGVTDADGVISLAVGSNVITVEVTAEDDSTTQTYTVTVTRSEPPSTDAALNALTLTGIDFGTFASGTTSYTAQVANSVSQMTLTPTVSDSGASYVVKLGGVEDDDREISLAVGSNVITIEVTAEDGETTRTYTVTVTRAEPPSTDASLSGLTLSGIDFGTFASGTTSYTAQVTNSVSQTTVTPTVNHSGASYVIKLGGVEDSDGTVSLASGSNVITIEVTAENDSTTRTYTVTVTRAEPPSTDASLSGLTLSGIDFGTFASGTTSYTAQVANSVTQTMVTPTVNDSGASYVIKLGAVVDADGVVLLSVGSSVITVEVTAEDGETTRTYTVTVTRAEPPSTDASLSGLTLSGIDFGTFASGTTSYTAQVTNSVSQTTVTPTVNHSGASYVIKLGGVEDSDGTVSLASGSNVITIEVTAENDSTTRTYTVTVTRAEAATDRAALVALYNATSGDNWANNDNWLSDKPLGEWHGVTTDSDGRVRRLDLSGNQLSGEVPSELGSLSNLETLFFGFNELAGPIPGELGNLSNLKSLNLSSNRLTGPIPGELGSLSNLESLDLSSNELTGIPGELGSLSNLETLYLSFNELAGPIPAELGSLSNLETLYLGNNRLTGTIPAELGSLSNLESLNLSSNRLTGPIPASLGGLANLERLSLSQNMLTGCVPEAWRDIAESDVLELGLPFCAVSLGTAPVFSDSEGNPITEAVRSVVENTAAGENVGAPVTAMDADNDTLTYSLGGTDMASFDIDPSTGQIMVGAGTMLDYETKASYMVTVTATDPDSASDMITVPITVTNEEETGEVTLWAGMDALTMAPQVGDTITGAVMDPDGGVTGETWQWSRTMDDMDSRDMDSWVDIEDATDDEYTVMEGDTGYYLRVMATYTDAVGTDTAMEYSMPTIMVTAEDLGTLGSRYDTDNNRLIDKEEAIAAVRDYFDDRLTKEETIEIIRLYFTSSS